MMMRVGHSGKHCRTVQIDDSGVRALVPLRLGVRPNEDHSVALYRDGLCPGLLIIRGVDVGIRED
jgi:hypothetical protein